jgi:hypothetical protein
MIKSYANSVLIPSVVTWTEQRISTYLCVPMISIDPIGRTHPPTRTLVYHLVALVYILFLPLTLFLCSCRDIIM